MSIPQKRDDCRLNYAETDIAKNILNDCYWDYALSASDIVEIVKHGDFRQKRKLFDKIIRNSRDKVRSVSLFSEEDIRSLVDSYYNSQPADFVDDHLKVIKNLLLDENNEIKRLKWRKK